MTGLKQQARVMAAADKCARQWPREAYTVWNVSHANQRNEGRPVEIGQQDSAEDAINAALLHGAFNQKDVLALLVTDRVSGDQTVRFYAIKRQSRAEYRRDPVTGEPARLNPLYPSELFALRVDAFAPVEPWKWTPGDTQ